MKIILNTFSGDPCMNLYRVISPCISSIPKLDGNGGALQYGAPPPKYATRNALHLYITVRNVKSQQKYYNVVTTGARWRITWDDITGVTWRGYGPVATLNQSVDLQTDFHQTQNETYATSWHTSHTLNSLQYVITTWRASEVLLRQGQQDHLFQDSETVYSNSQLFAVIMYSNGQLCIVLMYSNSQFQNTQLFKHVE
jgi:hypothetical protein